MTSVAPIYVEGDSVLIFRTSRPYTVERRIHYGELFTVDPESGAVTFANPPPEGSTVSLSAPNKLYTSYAGRACRLDYLDLTDRIVIGKAISENGCLKGLEVELFLDRSKPKANLPVESARGKRQRILSGGIGAVHQLGRRSAAA